MTRLRRAGSNHSSLRNCSLHATYVLLIIGTLGSCASSTEPPDRIIQPEPWPAPPKALSIPSDNELFAQIDDAISVKRGATFDRNFDAIDPGEGIEHATLSQVSIDSQKPSLEQLFTVGDELFEYAFRVENGLGNNLAGKPGVRAGNQPAPNMRRVHKSDFGGPDSYSCSTCHSKGGPDGAGMATQNAYLRGNGKNARSADERNPPHVLGLGPISALANEMSKALSRQRDAAVARARLTQEPQAHPLLVKGISFGTLLIDQYGTINTAEVTGIDPDLVVRPFGWKGHSPSIRAMAEESFRIHMGLLSTREQQQMRDGNLEIANYGNGIWFDLDRDNVHLEIDSGMLTTMVAYLSQLEVPIVRPPVLPGRLRQFRKGEQLFSGVGCSTCHRPSVTLHNPVLNVVPLDDRFRDRAPIQINVATDGDAPKISPATNGGYNVELFSDLKRHDMGDTLTSGYKQGHLSKSIFLTRPLWGLADTAPYLHDGRAPTVHDAIRWHGGEAAAAREMYLALDHESRSALLVYLLSLGRAQKLVVP